VWRSTVTVGLALLLAFGPSSARLQASEATTYYDVYVSGNDVTIVLHIDGQTTDLPTDCGLPFYPTEAWPNTIAYYTFWSTDSVAQNDISANITQTAYGGSGTQMCNGGGQTPSNAYQATFTFTDNNSGNHTFQYRLYTYDYNGSPIGDHWVYVPYSI
jgi:hypothetical protein